ncbi:MAG: transposase, partial [Cyanobacteriota bacterium]
MTRQRRRFTPQQKAEAITLCQNEGLTIMEASKRLGIHPTGLGRWVRQAGIDAQGPRADSNLPLCVQVPSSSEELSPELIGVSAWDLNHNRGLAPLSNHFKAAL